MSNDDPMWYSLPYHVTTLQKMYGPIPVLPTTVISCLSAHLVKCASRLCAHRMSLKPEFKM